MEFITIEKKEKKLVISGFDKEMNWHVRYDEHVKKIKEKFDEDKCDVILDLKTVEYMDSSTVGKIIHLAKHVDNYFYRLSIINVSKRIEKLLRLFKIEKMIQMSSDDSLLYRVSNADKNRKIYVLGGTDEDINKIKGISLSKEVVFLEYNKANIKTFM